MNTKGLEIKYQPISSGMTHTPDYSLIDAFFNKVEYTDKYEGLEGVYLFNFYDKEDDLHQLIVDLRKVYTDYKKWSKQFFIYFVMMNEIVRKKIQILRKVINNDKADMSKPNDLDAYLNNLSKEAFVFVLELALDEVDAINEANDQFFIKQIERAIELRRTGDLAASLGIKDTGNYFIYLLETCAWYFNHGSRRTKGFTTNGVFTTGISTLIDFDHCDHQLELNFICPNKESLQYVDQDLEVLRAKKKAIPVFTNNKGKEPKVTKIGDYKVLKNGKETICLTGSFITSPVEEYSLFEKSKLTVAGVEKILDINIDELNAKLIP